MPPFPHKFGYQSFIVDSRCFALLTGTYVEQGTHEHRYNELSSSIKEMLASMKEGFRRVDERFTAQERRFDDMNRRLDKQHILISLGFTAMVLVIAAFNLTIILS